MELFDMNQDEELTGPKSITEEQKELLEKYQECVINPIGNEIEVHAILRNNFLQTPHSNMPAAF